MQIISAETLSKAQIVSTEKTISSEQQIKIIEIFSEKLTSEQENERELAVRILGSLDAELSEKIMTAIAKSTHSDTLIRNIALELRDDIQRGYSYVVVGSFSKLEKAKEHAILLLSKNIPYQIRIFNNGKDIYAVCIEGQLSNREAMTIKSIIIKEFNIKDTYIKSSKIWKEIQYE